MRKDILGECELKGKRGYYIDIMEGRIGPTISIFKSSKRTFYINEVPN